MPPIHPFQAELRQARSSQTSIAQVYVENGTLRLVHQGKTEVYSLSSCHIPAALARVPRTITLPDDRQLLIEESARLAKVLASQPGQSIWNWIKAFESRLPLIAASLITVILAIFLFIQYGVPPIAKNIAFSLPENIEQSIGDRVIESLKKQEMFLSSDLTEQRRESVRSNLDTLIRKYDIQLHFFSIPAIGPNAFALPGGHVVINDQLIELAHNSNEILAVFAHEVGHISHKHSMRTLLGSSLLAMTIFTVTGDINSFGGLLVALPTYLMESSYSRNMEAEADQFATKWLQNNNISAQHLVRILTRMTDEHDGPEAPDFLSSHPGLEQRAAAISQHDILEKQL